MVAKDSKVVAAAVSQDSKETIVEQSEMEILAAQFGGIESLKKILSDTKVKNSVQDAVLINAPETTLVNLPTISGFYTIEVKGGKVRLATRTITEKISDANLVRVEMLENKRVQFTINADGTMSGLDIGTMRDGAGRHSKIAE